MKILVTGSKGFIGQALIKILKKLNYKILTFNSKDGDISDVNLYEKYKNSDISYIFHLAAKTFVPNSWENPIDFYKTSVIGTEQVLELCRKGSIPMTFVSAYIYGNPTTLPISEEDKIKPNNPYAHSKFLAEELCKFYSEFYNTRVVIARPFNIYGKNQNKNFLIPHIIEQVLNSDNIYVKDLNPKRDYVYIDDLIDGLIKTMSVKDKFSIFNFGSGIELSVEEIINIIQKVAKTSKNIISEKIERQNEIMSVVADISKAKSDLKWEPKFTFQMGVMEILKDSLNE